MTSMCFRIPVGTIMSPDWTSLICQSIRNDHAPHMNLLQLILQIHQKSAGIALKNKGGFYSDAIEELYLEPFSKLFLKE